MDRPTALEPEYTGISGVFAGYYNDVDGDVAFTVYDPVHTETGKGDEIEFSISLDKLADYLA